jgi:hypothetical protein
MTNKRIAMVLLALALVVGGFTLTPLKVAHAGSFNAPALFIHGFNVNSTINCNVGSEWGDTNTFFNNQGYTKHLSLGFYNHDSNCGGYLPTVDSRCSTYYNSGSNDGTVNEDIRYSACKLAWYIWDRWSQGGVTIAVVAFSFGGILIRQAMSDTPYRTEFPPYLLISDVATMGTPHQGLAGGTAWLFSHAPSWFPTGTCPGNCVEVSQMEVTNGVNKDLNSTSFRGGFGRDPQGSGGTDWTTMASNNDEVLAFCTGNEESRGAPPNVNGATICGFMPGATHLIAYSGSSPEYCHVCQNSYRQDESTAWNADMSYSDNNGGTWYTVSGMVHSVHAAYLAILYSDW